jgi:hypothetical protein
MTDVHWHEETILSHYCADMRFHEMPDRLEGIARRVSIPSPLSLGFLCKSSRADERKPISFWFVRVGDRTSGRCNVTGEDLKWWGRKWYISPHMTDSEIVQTIFLACKVAMEHELREQFKFEGQPVFDPHHDLSGLASAMHHKALGKATRPTP